MAITMGRSMKTSNKTRSMMATKLALIVALLTMGTALTLIFVVDELYVNLIKSQMVIGEGSLSFSAWSRPTVPVTARLYLFTMENAKDFLERGTKAKLKQMGPYVFRVQESKEDITFNEHNATVTYRVRKVWHFDEHRSNGSLNDTVVTLNIPAVAATAKALEGDNDLMQWGLASVMNSLESEVFIEKRVEQLLFKGYDDPILALADMFGSRDDSHMDKFGLFYKLNDSTWYDGVYNMHTGSDDLAMLGQIHSWNYAQSTHYRGECGKVRGSAGGLFPPQIDKEQVEVPSQLHIFCHQACRSLKFDQLGSTEVNGLQGVTYGLSSTTFANASVESSNACFENHLASGLQNLTTCKMETPAFLSAPHFFNADPVFRKSFHSGCFHPNAEEHDSRLTFNPQLGIPLQMALRLQLNMRLEPAPGFGELSLLRERVYWPIMWFDVSVSMPAHVTQSILMLQNLPNIVRVMCVVIVVSSGLLTAWLITKVSNMQLGCTKQRDGKAHVLKTNHRDLNEDIVKIRNRL